MKELLSALLTHPLGDILLHVFDKSLTCDLRRLLLSAFFGLFFT